MKKNINFLVIPKSPKVRKKVEKIGLGSFINSMPPFGSNNKTSNDP